MSHRCGKHVLLPTHASPESTWISCEVHRMGPTRLNTLFTHVTALEFDAEAQLHLNWIITHAMLHDA